VSICVIEYHLLVCPCYVYIIGFANEKPLGKGLRFISFVLKISLGDIFLLEILTCLRILNEIFICLYANFGDSDEILLIIA